MTPSWYDLLDVDESASESEIRQAWKSAIADLDPTDRRFRVCNQAAAVLLDPARRTAYDAEMAAETGLAGDVETQAAETPTSETRTDETTRTEPTGRAKRSSARPTMPVAPTKRGPRTPAQDTKPSTREPQQQTPTVRTSRAGLRVPAWLLIGLAVLVAAVAVTAGIVAVKVPSDASTTQGTEAAQGAAERDVSPVLSYDYRTLDEDKARAQAQMTPAFAKQYDGVFAALKGPATEVKAVVSAQLVGSSIVQSGADTVKVLLFFNQSTTNASLSTPRVDRNFVTATMKKIDGDWLVDDLATLPVGG